MPAARKTQDARPFFRFRGESERRHRGLFLFYGDSENCITERGAPRRTYAMNEEKNQEPARKRGFLIGQKDGAGDGALDIGFPFEIGKCIKNA